MRLRYEDAERPYEGLATSSNEIITMPQSRNNVTKQQWQLCDRCGLNYPMGSLVKQKGILVCTKCLDNLTVEHRSFEIERVLGANITEGVDTRVVDRGFFDGFDDQVQ